MPEDVLKRIMKAVTYAPSAKNLQPYVFVLVRDVDTKKKLVQACYGERWIAEAPIIVVALGNVNDAYPTIGGYMSSFAIDTAIAMDHLILAATNEGLGTCWIGAFDEEKVKKALGITGHDWRVVALTPLGYPAEEPEPRDKKNVWEIFKNERLE